MSHACVVEIMLIRFPSCRPAARGSPECRQWMGPTAVDRSKGMRPEAKMECSTPSSTTLNAASTTPRTG
jgi:hypothetical protein